MSDDLFKIIKHIYCWRNFSLRLKLKCLMIFHKMSHDLLKITRHIVWWAEKLFVITGSWSWMTNSYHFCPMSIVPPIPEIQLFQIWPWKSTVNAIHACGQSYSKVWPWKYKAKVKTKVKIDGYIWGLVFNDTFIFFFCFMSSRSFCHNI